MALGAITDYGLVCGIYFDRWVIMDGLSDIVALGIAKVFAAREK